MVISLMCGCCYISTSAPFFCPPFSLCEFTESDSLLKVYSLAVVFIVEFKMMLELVLNPAVWVCKKFGPNLLKVSRYWSLFFAFLEVLLLAEFTLALICFDFSSLTKVSVIFFFEVSMLELVYWSKPESLSIWEGEAPFLLKCTWVIMFGCLLKLEHD